MDLLMMEKHVKLLVNRLFLAGQGILADEEGLTSRTHSSSARTRHTSDLLHSSTHQSTKSYTAVYTTSLLSYLHSTTTCMFLLVATTYITDSVKSSHITLSQLHATLFLKHKTITNTKNRLFKTLKTETLFHSILSLILDYGKTY
ncbi:hypothetical protein TVAG_173260 [Trichomonas vaginalis G3]|uniref:Uncharacterized protein n=1 Tax=Trichomonas vaginalis (strain ATCC PRA-98 / G3) TaxID=412133 RepID=A2DF76_TRIV3|nr:hypothetical protein TVAGG3_0374190 [Trichomonas vaginalis G3]EAY21068.1 hypothetical protein TVAG_173260 [Trichomonas vaginalis G3]KAI5532821.1 hypothetical protein TVAGG3_0374190 [Trichomonas vaginalis G3]|eukprot:XP_001582054.1 hypothetical protein [Trichomonas vaginalis G3]